MTTHTPYELAAMRADIDAVLMKYGHHEETEKGAALGDVLNTKGWEGVMKSAVSHLDKAGALEGVKELHVKELLRGDVLSQPAGWFRVLLQHRLVWDQLKGVLRFLKSSCLGTITPPLRTIKEEWQKLEDQVSLVDTEVDTEGVLSHSVQWDPQEWL